jgi:hypothetical protein
VTNKLPKLIYKRRIGKKNIMKYHNFNIYIILNIIQLSNFRDLNQAIEYFYVKLSKLS